MFVAMFNPFCAVGLLFPIPVFAAMCAGEKSRRCVTSAIPNRSLATAPQQRLSLRSGRLQFEEGNL